ncbi:hypothetical protein [Streptosporangium lutulentum]|uniref:XRE-type DNA-binding protein n=1 Tax=Streptosporangium lutulentum TaxID=1461250 RepID=A0ABT9QHZ1_9ACTN|nr:hypothetical protein [Streptosporangium lutulentum]MDP9846372.1 putative XRE-type DNA-binding protein [Streptosporangium lutulentum]
MSTYHVTASRDEDWWGLVVGGPGLKRTYHTQVKRLDHAEAMARDLIALMLEIDESEVGDIDVILADAELAEELAATQQAREAAERQREEAGRRTRQIAQRMRARGYSQRDIGVLLGISHQAVGKLLDEKAGPIPSGQRLRKKATPSTSGKPRVDA